MAKPEHGITVGKVTYIHGAMPMQPNVIHDVQGPSPVAVDADWQRWRELEAERARRMTQQLDAAERDVSERTYEFSPENMRVIDWPPNGDYEPMPAEPSIRVYGTPGIIIGVDPASDRDYTAECVVDRYFGISDPHPYAWKEPVCPPLGHPDQSRAKSSLPPSDAPSLLLVAAILTVMTILGVAIINLFPSTVFAEFLQTLHLPR